MATSVERVQQALRDAGFDYEGHRDAGEHAHGARGGECGGVHRGGRSQSRWCFGSRRGRPLMVIASGANRVNETRVAEHVGEALGRADANFVRETTGFAIGGVAPVGHASPSADTNRRRSVAIQRDLGGGGIAPRTVSAAARRPGRNDWRRSRASGLNRSQPFFDLNFFHFQRVGENAAFGRLGRG